MKRILLAVLMLTANSSWAGWVEVFRTNKATLYADHATIRRSGDKVKIWYLMDFKTTEFDGRYSFLSSKEQREYDCKDERTRSLFSIYLSGHMGAGSLVYSEDGTPGNWKPIIPNSPSETLWKLACGKK